MRKNISGFTLMEAVVSMAVIAGVLITAPPMLKWLNQQGVGHAVDQLRSDLQLARVMAINRKQPCAIELNSPDLNQYQNAINRQVVNLDRYRGGVRFLNPGPDGNTLSSRIVFNRQGMSAFTPPQDLFLSDREGRSIYRIRVMMPGGISVYRWNGDRWQ